MPSLFLECQLPDGEVCVGMVGGCFVANERFEGPLDLMND